MPRSGQPPVTAPGQDRYIVLNRLENSKSNSGLAGKSRMSFLRETQGDRSYYTTTSCWVKLDSQTSTIAPEMGGVTCQLD